MYMFICNNQIYYYNSKRW